MPKKKASKKKTAVAKKKVAKVVKVPAKTPKKRGRPPGTGKKPLTVLSTECDDDYIAPKTYKFLGFCSKRTCNTMIMPLDLASKLIYVCPVCGKRERISKLKKELPGSEKPKSKREFLQSSNMLGKNE